MAQTEIDEFDDPGLKQAIRRVWADEVAPFELRARVSAACRSYSPHATSTDARIPLMLRLRSPLYGLAAAAMILIALGLSLRYWHGPTNKSFALTLPGTLAADLVARHDSCIQLPDHHGPGIDRDSFARIGGEMEQKLGFPVLSSNLPGSWTFHGASVCFVGSIRSAHLVFERDGKQFLSFFSLPPTAVKNSSDGAEYAEVDDHHALAGFATPAGFYCIVGSSTDGSLTLDQVRSIRDQLRPDVALAQPPAPLRLLAMH